MNIKSLFVGVITMMVVTFCGWYLVSCGGDDVGIEKEDVNNGGNNNNEDNKDGGATSNFDAPQELFGAWILYYQFEEWKDYPDIYVFKPDGTGKQYINVDYDDSSEKYLAQDIVNFTYKCNRQKSTLTLHGVTYSLDIYNDEYHHDHVLMTLSINNNVVMEFYSYDGELPDEPTPSVPTGVTATIEGSSIIVSWQSVSDANRYNIYRASSPDGSYTLIGTSSSATYKDNSPISGKNYYKVSAVNEIGESSQSSYAECNYTSDEGKTAPAMPTGLTATVNGSSILVSWQSVSGATSYRIYRSTSAYGSYSLIGTSYSASYRDDSPKSGNNYYRISAVNSYGESEQSNYASCNYTDGGGNSTKPNAPTNVTAVNVGNGTRPEIKISWSSVSNATSYNIYRSSSASGSYSQINSTSDLYYYDLNPLTGNNYYKVKAVNDAGESSYSSSAVCNVEVPPCNPSVKVTGTASQTVTWTPSTSAGCGKPTSYEAYKYNPIKSEWELKKTTTYTSYTPSSSDIHPGINRYIIKAINNAGEATGIGYSDNAPLATPSTFTVQKQDYDNIKFTWSKVAWATGYQIFMSTSAYGSYGIFDQVSDDYQTTCTCYYPGKKGETYYFHIRAVFYIESTATFIRSEPSSYKSIKF